MAIKSSPTPPRAACIPQQNRSRETLERILAAAEELLETREFDELTMVELARHAGCGVGTVYGRVPNKESLLLCLHERYLDAGMAGTTNMFEQCSDAPLAERVRRLCAYLVDFFAAHRGVTRAITNFLYTRPSDDISATVESFRSSATAGFTQVAAFLAEKVDPAIHPEPQVAAEFGLLAATDVAQSRIAFGDRSGLQINYSLEALKARIADLLLAYLQQGQPPRKDKS